MKKLWNFYCNTNLVLRIVIGLVIGVILGIFLPQLTVIGILGDTFVGALKSIAPLLVFVLIISSLANAKKIAGKQFRTVISLYMLSTFLAACVAVFGCKLFPVTVTLQGVDAATNELPGGLGNVLQNLVKNMVENPVASIINANYVGVLFWAIIFGIGLKQLGSDNTKAVLQDLSDTVTTAVRWIINLAPFGIMGIVFTTVTANGSASFLSYGKLLLLLVGCMLAVALIVDPFIAFICLRKNPYPLVLRCFRESGVTAFFTRSSAANIPVNMALCEKLGLDRNIYSVSIPLGATINMDGAAITITVMALTVAHSLGINVSIPSAILLSCVATLGACGASGVAGGSLLLIPLACSLFGVPNDIAMQAVSIGFVIGVVQDSLETAINSSGDVLFAATAEFMEWKKQGREIKF